MSAGLAGAGLRELTEGLAQVGDLKRVRIAGDAASLAGGAFASAWAQLLAGEPVGGVARQHAARALVATRLGGIDLALLREAGLTDTQAREVLRAAFDAAAAPFGETAGHLRATADAPPPPAPEPEPGWVAALQAQPRAGATHPQRGRLVLEPPESHAEHCWVVGVGAVLLAPIYGADPAVPFLCGLAHHLHNARLPDAGFAGEELLGEHLPTVLATLRRRALATLPAALRDQVEAALGLVPDAESPEGRAFNAADVLDRVLQQRHYAQVAAFTLDQALEEMELVHPGPLQAFGLDVLDQAGLR